MTRSKLLATTVAMALAGAAVQAQEMVPAETPIDPMPGDEIAVSPEVSPVEADALAAETAETLGEGSPVVRPAPTDPAGLATPAGEAAPDALAAPPLAEAAEADIETAPPMGNLAARIQLALNAGLPPQAVQTLSLDEIAAFKFMSEGEGQGRMD